MSKTNVKACTRKFEADRLLWNIGLVNVPSPNPTKRIWQPKPETNGKRLKIIFDTIVR